MVASNAWPLLRKTWLEIQVSRVPGCTKEDQPVVNFNIQPCIGRQVEIEEESHLLQGMSGQTESGENSKLEKPGKWTQVGGSYQANAEA